MMKKILYLLLFIPSIAHSTTFVSDNKSIFLENLAFKCAEIQYNLFYASTYDKENKGKHTYKDLNDCLELYKTNGGKMDLYKNIFNASGSSAYLYYKKCLNRSLRQKDGLSYLCNTFHRLGFNLTMTFICCPYAQEYISQGHVINDNNIDTISRYCMNECNGHCICY